MEPLAVCRSRDWSTSAHGLNGQPLTDEHGFPARLVIPGRYGMKGPKWLDRISVGASAVDGYFSVLSAQIRSKQEQSAEFHAVFVTRTLIPYELTQQDLRAPIPECQNHP
jgi:DMSO/TMAO reductase YedYZ molybdopterin-dependent catalytic subunit